MGDRITCVQCHLRIDESAQFCENCGSKVSSPKRSDVLTEKSEVLDSLAPAKSNNNTQNLIFIGLMILCGSTIYHFTLSRIVDYMDNWELYSTMEPLSYFITFCAGTAGLLIAFGLKPGSKKTVALIFASIYVLIHFYWIVDWLIPDEPPFEYLQF